MENEGVTRVDYEADAVAAAKSVMLELFRALGEYRDQLVLVGGWVPDLLFPDAHPKHIGSMDVDLALDHRRLDDEGYLTIAAHLAQRGYERDQKQPFVFRKTLKVGARDVTVKVDLLAGEYGGTGKGHRTQKVQDVQPRKARGCDFALESFVDVTLSGTLPNGAVDSARIRIASVVALLVMKGMALADRLKEKDAYDVYFCVKQFPGGIAALAAEFHPHLTHGLVKEGLRKLSEKFATEKSFGPIAVADFYAVADGEQRDMLVRDAFEQVRALLDTLGFGPSPA